MAINTDTLKALDLVKDLLTQQKASKEREKDRGLRIAELKIRSDEAELERMGRLYQMKVEQEQRLRNKAIELGVFAERTRGSGTGASQAAGTKLNQIVSDRGALQEEIGRLDESMGAIESAIISRSEGFQAGNALHDSFRALGKPGDLIEMSFVDPDEEEFGALIEHAKKLGFKVTDSAEFRLGLQTAIELAGQQEFENRVAQRQLELSELQMRFKAEQGQAPDLVGELIDDYRQLISNARVRADELGLGKTFAGFPSVDANAESVMGARDALSLNIAEVVSQAEPWKIAGGFGGKLETLMENYKQARSESNLAAMKENATEVAALFKASPHELKQLSTGFSFSGDPDSQKKLRFHMHQMVDGLNMLDTAQRLMHFQKYGKLPTEALLGGAVDAAAASAGGGSAGAATDEKKEGKASDVATGGILAGLFGSVGELVKGSVMSDSSGASFDTKQEKKQKINSIEYFFGKANHKGKTLQEALAEFKAEWEKRVASGAPPLNDGDIRYAIEYFDSLK